MTYQDRPGTLVGRIDPRHVLLGVSFVGLVGEGQPGHGPADRAGIGVGGHAEGFVPGEGNFLEQGLDGVGQQVLQDDRQRRGPGGWRRASGTSCRLGGLCSRCTELPSRRQSIPLLASVKGLPLGLDGQRAERWLSNFPRGFSRSPYGFSEGACCTWRASSARDRALAGGGAQVCAERAGGSGSAAAISCRASSRAIVSASGE